MKVKINLLFIITLFLSISVFSQKQDEPICNKREHIILDDGWRFALGNATDITKDFYTSTGYFTYLAKTGYGDGASVPQFEDRTWREVDLPHDWAVELPFSSDASHSHGYRTIGWKYPEMSVGWYRKKFNLPVSDLGRKISIQFDGIHRNSIVWVNGFYVGNEKSGYASSVYDITDYLNYGAENTIAVRVDASMEEGWYYEGAGIYRHVWLNKTDRLHVGQNGTFITSELDGDNAELTVRTNVNNEYDRQSTFTIEQVLINVNNQPVVSTKLENVTLKGNLQNTWFQKINVEKPTLWTLENPYLYKLKTNIIADGNIVDSYITTVGIRTLRFDPNLGFFLNGKSVKIKGTNNHQDHAGVGTAIPDTLQEFRVKKLIEMGSNAIRTSHNPPTPELLDICDRLGMLVLDENRLMGINQEHLDLLERFMVRDRNHPSVILWSLGNEEWAIESNEKGARITKTMQEFAQNIDSSRAFTVAVSGGWDNGSGKIAQVMGYNYIVQGNIDEHHKKFPWQCGIGTEESNTIGTRGVYADDKANGRMAATNRMPENVGTESGWKFYAERPFLSGLFFWTGFDYRGEANPLSWPAVNSEFGIVDLCGFPKDIFYYLKSWWGTKPVMHIMPHWTWKGSEGKNINVTIYSNSEEVELVLNNKSLGKRSMPTNGHLDWDVVYMPGTLLARGFVSGKMMVSEQLETTDVPAKVALSSDRLQLKADGEDVAIITVQLNDLKNRLVPTGNKEIAFTLSGPGKIIGVGNGDPASHDPEQFLDSVERLNIVDLHYKLFDSSLIRNEIDEMNVDSGWSKAFQKGYGVYENGKSISIRGFFNLDHLTDKTTIEFFIKKLVDNQSVYVNGKSVNKDLKSDDPNQVLKLDNNMLHKGLNTVVLVGKPFVKKTEWEELNTSPGTIKVVYPASPWKRKTFNGFAQIIVKTTKQTGDITLLAGCEGLIPATLKMKSTEVNSVK
ncbi:MAG: beta-galactosidase GalA [Paludibacter sp.]|nr:beta-galactosidase GalA [Paludibacter sp.]